MRRRNIEELSIYELQTEADSIDSSLLLDLYMKKASDTIYFTLKGKLYGIVSLKDLQNRMKDSIVPINCRFSKMNCFDEEQARVMFFKNRFTKIPVVDDAGCLIGDYTHLDDTDEKFLEWLADWECIWIHLKKWLKYREFKKIYIVDSGEGKQDLKTYIVKMFETAKVSFTLIEKEELNILEQNTELSLIIAAGLEELRSVQCISAVIRLVSNSKLICMCFTDLWIGVANFARDRKFIYYNGVIEPILGEKLLQELQDRGISILSIYSDAYYASDYTKNLFQKNLYHSKNRKDRFWPVESEIGKGFFGELLDIEDYRNGIAQRDIVIGYDSLSANYTGKYYNRIDGYRKTCYQPEQYYGTIYLFGPCLVSGYLAEDKYTMASQLQKKLDEEGYPYLVVNRGRTFREPAFHELYKTVFHSGDVIIIYTGNDSCKDIESVEIRRLFEENKVPSEWCTDLPVHMNHKATGLVVASLYDKLKKHLVSENGEAVNKEDIVIGNEDQFRILNEFTKTIYLDTWFGSIDPQVKRGGILADFDMAPYMLEQVLPDIFTLVEELIVFVTPVGIHLYTWREYVAAILKMSSPEHKIRVVPGDRFVPYYPILTSYYSDDELTEEAAAEEAASFAECIAKPLNIQYRFGFGSGTSEKMAQYNQILKTELPGLGVQYIEFESSEDGGRYHDLKCYTLVGRSDC